MAKEMSNDIGKDGYKKSSFGGNEDDNYRIKDGYVKKDESPSRSEATSTQEIGHHSVTGELYSGDPEGHGHKNKSAAVYKAGSEGTSKPKEHAGGGKNKEE